jgi:hypothetical protein
MSLVSTALTFHHVALFASKGFEPTLAAGVLSCMAPMALAGSYTAGFLTDKVPNRSILAAALTLFVCAIVWTMLLVWPWQAFLYGAGADDHCCQSSVDGARTHPHCPLEKARSPLAGIRLFVECCGQGINST